MRKKMDPPRKPLTLADVKDIVSDVLEVLNMDARSFAAEYAPDIKTHNKTLLRIFTDGARIGLTKKLLKGLADLIDNEEERRRDNG